MTSRERELAAIRHTVPDRVPVDVICIETVPEIAEHLGIGQGDVYPRLGIDGRIIGAPFSGAFPVGPGGQPLSDWGTETPLDYGTAHWYPLADARTTADVERAHWPSPDDYDYAAAAGWAAADCGRHALRGPAWTPVFSRVCEMMGLEETLIRMHSHAPAVDAALRMTCEINLECYRRLLDACGDALDIFCMGDDFATQRGLMMAPTLWRATLKPLLAAIFDMAHARGKIVWFHSCGDVTAVLDDLIDIGVDVWETVQLHTLPMTPTELKRRFGARVAFCGGINTQRLPYATPQEVRDEVRAVIDALGEGGGLILGPDHHIKPDAPSANTLALFDTATAYRRRGWTTG